MLRNAPQKNTNSLPVLIGATRRRCWLAAKQHNDMPDLHDEMSGKLCGEFRPKFLLLLLEFVEFHFHEFMVRERFIDGFKKRRAEPFPSDLEARFKKLSTGL